MRGFGGKRHKQMRKNIDISDDLIESLDELAIADNRVPKNYIEAQIEFLLKKKINCIDQWYENQTLKSQLHQLTK